MSREEAYAIVQADLIECARHTFHLAVEVDLEACTPFAAEVVTRVSRKFEPEADTLLELVDALLEWHK
jgi:hypothetical protein